MPLQHHKNLTLEHWSAFSLAEQMANIGSEVGRIISHKNRDNKVQATLAAERALELIDLTVADQKNRPRWGEILRMREVLVDWYYYDNEYGSSDELWDKYFLPFNYLARINT